MSGLRTVLVLTMAVMLCSFVVSVASEGCEYNGETYAVGESYDVDCNTCNCVGDDLATCTLMACPP